VDNVSLYAFLLDWSELSKTFGEAGTYLKFATYLDTADPFAQEQLAYFHQVTQPAVTVAEAALHQKVLAIPNPDLPPEATMVLRRMQTDQLAYREENVPIEAEEADLITGILCRKRTGGLFQRSLENRGITIISLPRRFTTLSMV
jgi:hypothetical protein